MAAIGAMRPFSVRLPAPVDGDPALRWRGSASPEMIMITGTPFPLGEAIPGTRVA